MPKKIQPPTSEAQAEAQGLANLFNVLSDPKRLRISQMLFDHPKGLSPSLFQERLGLGQSLVSHHLKIMRDAHVVHAVQEGTSKRYTLTREARKVFNVLVPDVAEFKLTDEERAALMQAVLGKSAHSKGRGKNAAAENDDELKPDIDLKTKSHTASAPRPIINITPVVSGEHDVLYIGAKPLPVTAQLTIKGDYAFNIRHAEKLPKEIAAKAVIIDARGKKGSQVMDMVEALKEEFKARPVYVISDNPNDTFGGRNEYGADWVVKPTELQYINSQLAFKLALQPAPPRPAYL